MLKKNIYMIYDRVYYGGKNKRQRNLNVDFLGMKTIIVILYFLPVV